MSTMDVCRLCLSKGNLLCVFDKRVEGTDHLKDVILITTGVEIHLDDVISQKICPTCSQNAVKMYQFRQQSLKNDQYLKARCRELLKHADLKISNTNVTSKPERINVEEKKQEPRRMPSYKVHPTMMSLFRKYPKLQLPSICMLSHVDPCVTMEMDTVENYFKSRNMNMKKYAHLAIIASDRDIPKKSSTIMKSTDKNTEYTVKHKINENVAPSTSTAISETVDNTEVVHRVRPINIKLNQSGYSIVRPSTENIIYGEDRNVCESTSTCEQLITDSPESQSCIRKPKKRRISDSDLSSEPEIKKVPSVNPSKMISVLSNIEIKSPSVFKCNICGSIQFSSKHLKKHEIRHSRCKFCKIQFKSIGMKQQHIKYSCFGKGALNNFPDVEIERIELNMNERIFHQDAFAICPPLPGLEKMDSSPIPSEESEEIIEIISDDEDTPASTMKPICSKTPALTQSTLTPTFHRNPAVSTMIRPSIKMKNDNVLDSLKTPAPDLEIIKELLTNFRNLQSVTHRTDRSTQIELPTTESIRMDGENLTAELINLKQVLHLYHLPVKIQRGSKVSVSYNYQRTRPKRKKILKLWTDLTSIDVEPENNLISNKTANSERVITVTHAIHSNNIANDVDSVNRIKSCDSNGTSPSSNSLQAKSPAITSNQIESRTPTPESLGVVQAEPLKAIPAQSSFNTDMRNRRRLLVSPHALEIIPVQATSPVTDIPNSRQSPKTSGIDQTTTHINSNSLEIHSVQTISSTPSGRISSGADQTTLQNNTIAIPTNCAQCYVNTDSPRKSPHQNLTELNANWSLLSSHSEVVGYSKSVDTTTINARCPNNNNQQQSSYIRQARPKSSINQRNQMVHFSTATRSYHDMNVHATTNSNVSSQNYYGIKEPSQSIVAANTAYFGRSLPNPNGNTLVSQTPQSYISSHTSNIPPTFNTAKTVETGDTDYNAFIQCNSRVQECIASQPTVELAGISMSNSVNTDAHHRQTGLATAWNLLQKVHPGTRVSQSLSCYRNQSSVTFPHYSKASNYVNGSITVSPVNQDFDVSDSQLPNTCSYQSILAACDTSPYSVLAPSDISQHFVSGLIRVRNVKELT